MFRNFKLPSFSCGVGVDTRLTRAIARATTEATVVKKPKTFWRRARMLCMVVEKYVFPVCDEFFCKEDARRMGSVARLLLDKFLMRSTTIVSQQKWGMFQKRFKISGHNSVAILETRDLFIRQSP